MRRAGALAAALCLTAGQLTGETIRIAAYDTDLFRDGPGLLLADILDDDPQVRAVVEVISEVRPDVIHLMGFDWDLEGHALHALAAALSEAGVEYPHRFAGQPNTGVPSGLDLDGNGRVAEARDNSGYGTFTGQGGMAVLSRYPIGAVREFTDFLWRDLPGAQAPAVDGAPFPSAEAAAQRRLSSVAHWDVPVEVEGMTLHLLAWHGTAPVFDGPEDLNGARGADEALFWLKLLDGALPWEPPAGPFVLTGISNIDPVDGDGRHGAMRQILSDPRLQDPQPVSAGGVAGANPAQGGDPALDTGDFDDPEPGNLRVDYVLPDAALTVTGSGVYWPAPGEPMAETVATASHHRLVWVDVALP
ncbi:endonuclease/exonuclease/phosphatase family protein [Maritimibacter sp. UBA3975]|uniref:endonuclease/exonuclease/phosphatase family protein n=1 Tax=Maritimibacter sp. UBA3975 TaxID=1946833 RepID=UPI0025BC3C7D|nr:endonuclease/exonuclease/phosphatase family protein [Maritimibacter sp. UBA3975]